MRGLIKLKFLDYSALFSAPSTSTSIAKSTTLKTITAVNVLTTAAGITTVENKTVNGPGKPTNKAAVPRKIPPLNIVPKAVIIPVDNFLDGSLTIIGISG